MERKSKTTEPEKETSLARPTTVSPFAWFDEVDRWFDSFRRSFEERFWGSPLARFRGSDLQVREPLVDLIDKGSEFVVRAELPGVAKEDVDLTVAADGIEIRARTDKTREEKEKGYYYQERRYQAFERALAFPEAVKADLAVANLKDGVLQVRIPKVAPTPESKPVKVPVE
ncbi:MAG TPA: Hsp20/alpha crystallin family protein [Thermoplasmata archaeon]|jgi:HSP20 family protein|nr:Hsp20/alpha crystallin family protein [Thermoplasmata archaeon]